MSDSDDSVEISDVELSDDDSTLPSDDEDPNASAGAPRGKGRISYVVEDDIDHEEIGDDTALAQIKEDKFYERVNHFMNAQRKVEERMQRIDANDRLKAIEVTNHSGGIKEPDSNTYKTMYQQQNMNGEPAKNLGEVYETAYGIKQKLRDLLDAMVDKVKGLDYIDARIVDLKPRDAANNKAREEYLTRTPGPPESWMYDVLRSTVTCKTMKQVESVNKFLTKKAHIVQVKNRFQIPAFSGYRDILYHVLLTWTTTSTKQVTFVAEIQVHHKEVANLEKMFGLMNHYKYFRPIFAVPDRSDVQTLRDIHRFQKAGKINEKLIDKIFNSVDANQLYVYGKLFDLKLENYEFAQHLYSRALKIHSASESGPTVKSAALYQDIGLVQAKLGDYDQALRSLQSCLEHQQEVFGQYNAEVAITRSLLGDTIVERGDDSGELLEHRGALQQYKKALVIREKCLGEDHLDVAGSYQNIGRSLCKLGDFQGALAAYRESLSILESLLGENHADVATAHCYLGNVLHEQGDFQAAMEEYSFGLAIREEVFGKGHKATAESHTLIGQLLTDAQDYDEAEARHRQALVLRDTLLGKESPESAESHYWIGYVLNQKGDYAAALKEHETAYTIRSKILPKGHPDIRASLISIRTNENEQPEQ